MGSALFSGFRCVNNFIEYSLVMNTATPLRTLRTFNGVTNQPGSTVIYMQELGLDAGGSGL
jgi:hypothetical protein